MAAYRMGRAAGYIRIDEPGRPTIERDTLMCVHCNQHWWVEPGSGRQRGFCPQCNGPHCGGAACWTCVPLERKVEAGLARQRMLAQAGLPFGAWHRPAEPFRVVDRRGPR